MSLVPLGRNRYVPAALAPLADDVASSVYRGAPTPCRSVPSSTPCPLSLSAPPFPAAFVPYALTSRLLRPSFGAVSRWPLGEGGSFWVTHVVLLPPPPAFLYLSGYSHLVLFRPNFRSASGVVAFVGASLLAWVPDRDLPFSGRYRPLWVSSGVVLAVWPLLVWWPEAAGLLRYRCLQRLLARR